MYIVPFSARYQDALLRMVQSLREYIVSCDTQEELCVYDMASECQKEDIPAYEAGEKFIYLALNEDVPV